MYTSFWYDEGWGEVLGDESQPRNTLLVVCGIVYMHPQWQGNNMMTKRQLMEKQINCNSMVGARWCSG